VFSWFKRFKRFLRKRLPHPTIFPIGIFIQHVRADILKDVVSAGMNTVLPYHMPDEEQMNLAESLGIKVIYPLNGLYHTFKPDKIDTPEAEKHHLQQVIDRFKHHPAILAWYIADDVTKEVLPRVKIHYRWIRHMDPSHPIYRCTYRIRNRKERDGMKNTFDILGSHPYPIGRPGAQINSCAIWASKTALIARTCWQVVQCHNWKVYGHDNGRSPTREEIGNMMWQQIIGGGGRTRGILFYSYFDMKRAPDVTFEPIWQSVVDTTADLKTYLPVILSRKKLAGIKVEGDESVIYMTRAIRDTLYLFLVNTSYQKREVNIRFSRRLRRKLTVAPHASGFKAICDPLENRVLKFDLLRRF
jgi:hypothetical protein